MKNQDDLGFPQAFLNAVESDPKYIPNLNRIGVTALIESPYIRKQYIENYDNLVIPASDYFKGFDGIAFHKRLEKHCPKNCRAEVKWECKIKDITLVGKADLVSEGIEDYKKQGSFHWVKKNFEKSKLKITQQLNCLNWLKFKNENKQAKFLCGHIFINDWSPFKKLQQKDYPPKYFRLECPLWSLEQTESFINKRLKLHLDKNYKCTDEDKWIRVQAFAVMKEGRKSALRVLSATQEAYQWIQDNRRGGEYQRGRVTIQERKSEAVKCKYYCKVRSICPFAKSLRK